MGVCSDATGHGECAGPSRGKRVGALERGDNVVAGASSQVDRCGSDELTVVVLFAAARLFSQTLAVVPSSRKTSPPTSTVELLSGADVNDTEPSVTVMGLLALRESSSGRPRRHRSQCSVSVLLWMKVVG
jgi:hypothetical protein